MNKSAGDAARFVRPSSGVAGLSDAMSGFLTPALTCPESGHFCATHKSLIFKDFIDFVRA
ncbi:MAG TPA: hypothetical protein PK229_08650 [Rhodocyclaceae bacterium]|uniref:hypothetical protein n=1 Tax=Zoogloea sp. TaxID=49181 RepID=UPI002CD1FFC5|nr:hypothetical protein [Zoogloea sp.]HND24371.1 hypothetical protein [Rhodocyclaceae bacterium]